MTPVRRLAVLMIVAALAGCGGSASESEPELTLALDFTPNAVHAPLYAAADREAFAIRRPGSGPDGLKLLAAGKVDLAVLDIHDLALARQEGTDVVAVAALVQRPLAALAARPPVTRPRDLEGRTVGVSGLPSDTAFLRAIVEDDGGDPDAVKQVTIGFSAVTRLLSGRVAAAPVFWNAEGVVLRRRGLDLREFRVDDFGAPPYPELVIVARADTVRTRREELRRAVRAIANGIQEVRGNPRRAAARIAEAAGTDDVGLVREQLDAVRGLFGVALDRAVLERWAAFDARIGIVDRPPDVGAAFDFDFGKDPLAKAS